MNHAKISELISSLCSDVQRLNDIDLDHLSPDDTVSVLEAVISLERQTQAVSARLQHRAHSVQVRANGHRCSATDAAVEHSGACVRSSATDRRLAAWADEFPVLSEAYRQGQISRQHLAVLRRVDNPTTRDALVEHQAELVNEAIARNWKSFTRHVGYFAHRHDPDGETAKRKAAQRRLTLTEHADGTVSGRFHLDAVNGQAVRNALEFAQQRLLQEDQDQQTNTDLDLSDDDAPILHRTDRGTGTGTGTGTGDAAADGPASGSASNGASTAQTAGTVNGGRTRSQRLADAFVELLRSGHQHGAVAPQPLVHIVMSQSVAEDTIRRLANPDSAAPQLDADNIDGRCEFQDGTPLHPTVAVAELTIATLQRVVFSTPNVVLELGRKSRSFPRELAQVVRTRHRAQCAHPNCDSPVAWLQTDHVQPWNRGGPTDVANGQPLCGAHNRAKADAA